MIKQLIKKRKVNEDGFSLLELVVAVGILLVLTIGGLLAYNGLTKNARVAAVQSAASEVLTGAVAADVQGKSKEDIEAVGESWNDSGKGVIETSVDASDRTCIIVKAFHTEHTDIKSIRGTGNGCVYDEDGNLTNTPGDNTGGSDDGDDTVIVDPAAACFDFDDGTGTITDYDEDNCSKDVIIPETINGEAVVHIGGNAFFDNGLTSVVFNEGLKTIGDYAFAWNQLEGVEFNDGFEEIGYYAFESNQLTGSIVFPSTLKTIGAAAFSDNQLTSVVLNDGLETISEDERFWEPNGTFQYNQLTGSIVIPDSVKTIGYQAFSGNGLTSVIIGDSVETIGDYAFEANQLAGSIVFPSSLKTIGEWAFKDNRLMRVEFKEGLETIGEEAFNGNPLGDRVHISRNTAFGDELGTFGSYGKIVYID